jgi:hypothetical protein
MAFVGRLILRLIVVPLGGALAVVAGVIVSFIANWSQFPSVTGPPDDPSVLGSLLLAAAWAYAFALSTAQMLMPGAIGVLVAEVFVIRSVIFHALNGAVSMWVGWWTSVAEFRQQTTFYDRPLTVLSVGLAAGFVYWGIAGWNAGLFKPTPAVQPGPPATPR